MLPTRLQREGVVGEDNGVDTGSSLLYSSNRLIATVGLADMMVVDPDHAVLVCPKGRAQEVKSLVEALRKNKLK